MQQVPRAPAALAHPPAVGLRRQPRLRPAPRPTACRDDAPAAPRARCGAQQRGAAQRTARQRQSCNEPRQRCNEPRQRCNEPRQSCNKPREASERASTTEAPNAPPGRTAPERTRGGRETTDGRQRSKARNATQAQRTQRARALRGNAGMGWAALARPVGRGRKGRTDVRRSSRAHRSRSSRRGAAQPAGPHARARGRATCRTCHVSC